MTLALAALVCMSAADGVMDKHDSCRSWAESGECQYNPGFMQENCAKSCNEAVKSKSGEPEQCAGWAAQGEW